MLDRGIMLEHFYHGLVPGHAEALWNFPENCAKAALSRFRAPFPTRYMPKAHSKLGWHGDKLPEIKWDTTFRIGEKGGDAGNLLVAIWTATEWTAWRLGSSRS